MMPRVWAWTDTMHQPPEGRHDTRRKWVKDPLVVAAGRQLTNPGRSPGISHLSHFTDCSEFFGGQQILVAPKCFLRGDQIVESDHSDATPEELNFDRRGVDALKPSDARD